MILIIGPYPNPKNEKDGMVQRVLVVDGFFRGVERVYLDARCWRNLIPRLRKLHGDLSVWEVNCFIHFALIFYLAIRAKGILVHSVYYAKHILPMYIWKKVVTDMHGIVPEERLHEGRKIEAWFYGKIEAFAVRHSYLVIVVTQAMEDHLRSKYGRCCSKMLIVPNLCSAPFPEETRGHKGNRLTVIYCGGAHVWQNVDLMVDAMTQLSDRFEFVVLTGDMEVFRRKLGRSGLDGFVKLATVPKAEVGKYYLQADLGFVLREDNIINRVACPTKLVEYLAYGIIPIVLQPRIGDFAEYGYSYVLLSDLLAGNIPSDSIAESMRASNYKVLQRMRDLSITELTHFAALFTSVDDGGMPDSASCLDK